MPRANKGALVWLGQGLGVAVAVLVQKGSNKQTEQEVEKWEIAGIRIQK